MKKIALGISLFAFPLFAQAQDLSNIEELVKGLGDIVEVALPVVVGIALLAFFWGLAKYIFSAGDSEKKEEGRNIMIWGVIALFVMISVWGITKFIGDAIGIDQVDDVDPPGVQGL